MSLICLKCDKVKGSIYLYDDYNYTLTSWIVLYFLKEIFYNIKKEFGIVTCMAKELKNPN